MNVSQIINMVKVHSGIPSAFRLMRVKHRKRKHDKIRVVFVCQLPQVWSCIQSVYEAACKDSQTEPYILAVPEKWEENAADENVYQYLEEQGYAFFRAFDREQGAFFDLKALEPDYVFLPRPYDSYLPGQYRSEQLSKYTKVCYVAYGYTSEGGYILKTVFSKYFVTNCYMVFAENTSTQEYCRKKLPISTVLGIRKIIKTPYPRFDLCIPYREEKDTAWMKSREQVQKRIIWAFRWTLDEKLGGTNFFNYKDFFFEFAQKHIKHEILIRPHPMAFDNFVKVKAMTEAEVGQYKKTCKELENVQLDMRKEYLDTFASADILVADMSSVLIDFAVLEKPIIFCSYETEVNEANRKLIEGFYVVHSQEELENVLEMLCRGEDPKKEERIRLVHEILGVCDGKNGKRIVDLLKQDCSGQRQKEE